MSTLGSFLQPPPKISVVIPAFNEAHNIRRCLQALCLQSLPADEFEVLVVDNGSTDDTVGIASSFSGQLTLRVVTKTNCRISAVRNFGAALAQGRLLAFLDADCIAPARWLEDSLGLGLNHAVWGAHYLVPEDSTWVGRVWFDHQAKAQEGAVSFIPGGDLFMQHADFDEIGGFGESLETSEDVELSQRARQHGFQVLAFTPLAVSHEGTAQTLRHFYRQNRWHGTTVLRIFLANLPSMTNLPLVALSLYTLLLFWATVVSVPFAILHRAYRPPALLFGLLCLPAVLLSLGKALRARSVRDIPALIVLYMTYLFARAASITKLSKRNHR